MGTIVFFDTSVGTFNHGDDIIMESVYRELAPLLKDNFKLNFATHLVNFKQPYVDYGKVKECRLADYKFICGTDIIWPDLLEQKKKGILQFSAVADGLNMYKNSVLLGAGIKKSKSIIPSNKSAKIYKSSLSSELIHSVRDEKAREFIQSLGLNVINTGCPTLWMLTEEFCKNIPTVKTSNCVFALTSENRDFEADKIIVETIMKNYSGNLFFWIQRINDEKYLESLIGHNSQRIRYIYNLNDYDALLKNEDIDYVGTRLHGGIYALQHKRRAIIISIDHRASGMSVENNLPCISRMNIKNTKGNALNDIINSTFDTKIKLNIEGIREFKKQFI